MVSIIYFINICVFQYPIIPINHLPSYYKNQAVFSSLQFLISNLRVSFRYLIISFSLASSCGIFCNLPRVDNGIDNVSIQDGYSDRSLATMLALLSPLPLVSSRKSRPGMEVPGFIAKWRRVVVVIMMDRREAFAVNIRWRRTIS